MTARERVSSHAKEKDGDTPHRTVDVGCKPESSRSLPRPGTKDLNVPLVLYGYLTVTDDHLASLRPVLAVFPIIGRALTNHTGMAAFAVKRSHEDTTTCGEPQRPPRRGNFGRFIEAINQSIAATAATQIEKY